MKPLPRPRLLSLFLAACLALVAVLCLAADGRAATNIKLPSNLAYVDFMGNIYTTRDADYDANKLTNDFKRDDYPVWSPDGSQFVFARRFMIETDEQERELFRMNADGSGLQRLTDNDLIESWSVWSPDGARLAFAAGDLYVMPISAAGGGAPVRLTTGGLNPQHLAWSPDGTRLAFNSWPCPGQAECAAAELYVVTVPGGQLTRLTNNAAYDGDPAWSPDGARLVYESGPADSTDLHLIPAAGGSPTPLVTADTTTDPAWSPDGAFIAYVKREQLRDFFPYHLEIIRPSGADTRRLLDNAQEPLFDPVWSPDSQSVIFRLQQTPCGMACGAPEYYLLSIGLAPDAEVDYLVNMGNDIETTSYSLSTTTNLVVLARGGVIYVQDLPLGLPRPLTGLVPVNGDPAWSPDGLHLAFSSQRDFNYNIHVMDAAGNDRAALTTHPGNDWNPTWSAANRIAFNSNRDGNWELYVMNADGSGQTNLTNTPTIAEADAAWSPNGRQLAFARQEAGNWDIYLMNADGSGLARLTSHAAPDHNPTWSPDGARLAFQTDRDGNSEIYVLTVAGPPGNETNLTHSPGDEREPAWSPYGTKIACAFAHPDGDNMLLMIDANGGANLQALGNTGPSPQPAWRPIVRTPRLWLPAIRG